MAENVRTDTAKLLRHAEAHFRQAVELTADDARRNLTGSGGGSSGLSASVRAEFQGPLEARVGTDHPGGKAQERGAYITPKRARALKFADGGFRPRARLRAKKWLQRAGEEFRANVLSARVPMR